MKPFPTRSYRWTLFAVSRETSFGGFLLIGAFKTRRAAEKYDNGHHRRDITVIGGASFPAS